ncbi:MAG: hypothetical protein J5I98_29615 [Phaeodactylibacter sp.]|nr:hypothetical protein [Phaeodactylibacter sp.]
MERTEKSTSEIRVNVPHYSVFSDFENTSYLDRYQILCRKMMLERHYTATALLWTSRDSSYGNVSEDFLPNLFPFHPQQTAPLFRKYTMLFHIGIFLMLAAEPRHRYYF